MIHNLQRKQLLPCINSYGAIVKQERRKVGCRNYTTRRVLIERAKMLANETKYFSYKGLYVWLFTVQLCKQKSVN